MLATNIEEGITKFADWYKSYYAIENNTTCVV
jgi:hypothetical protein